MNTNDNEPQRAKETGDTVGLLGILSLFPFAGLFIMTISAFFIISGLRTKHVFLYAEAKLRFIWGIALASASIIAHATFLFYYAIPALMPSAGKVISVCPGKEVSVSWSPGRLQIGDYSVALGETKPGQSKLIFTSPKPKRATIRSAAFSWESVKDLSGAQSQKDHIDRVIFYRVTQRFGPFERTTAPDKILIRSKNHQKCLPK